MDSTSFQKVVIARGNLTGEEEGIDYVPDDTRKIVLWRGSFGPSQIGDRVSAEEAMAKYRKVFIELGGEWFLPILERMARGEAVSIDEILRHGEAATGQTPKVTAGPTGER